MAQQLLKSTKSIEIKELLHLGHRSFFVEKDSYIFREGMPAEEVYIILDGKVEISKISNEGRVLTLRISGANEICGELILYTKSPEYLLSAKVLEDAKILAIKKERLEEELLNNRQLTFEFMKYMSDHIRKTHTKFRDLVLIGRRGALISTLIRLSNSYGVHEKDGIFINQQLTNQQLANFCGISRESSNKILNALRREKKIEFDKGYITIKKLQELRNEIGCENCPELFCSIE